MSDDDKPTPESPESGASEAPPQRSGASVISIDQARVELLQRKVRGATPPKGTRPRARSREVPQPVTLPPGEHSAVIVTDTPAARAHVEKKTVHPGEQAEVNPVDGKRVRVKTHFDPRRAKTQLTGKKPSNEILGDGTVPSLWGNADAPSSGRNGPSQPPSVSQSQPPPAQTPSGRPLFARPRPLPRDQRNSPLFLFGIAVAAAAGAAVVYYLSRPRDPEPPRAPDTSITATAPSVTAPGNSASAGNKAPPPATSASTGVEDSPSQAPQATAKTGAAPSTKPTASASAKPTATTKPTATSILPFGKDEP